MSTFMAVAYKRVCQDTGEPDDAKVSSPVVRPAKAGAFSGRQSHRSKSQTLRSLDGREERNRCPEAHRRTTIRVAASHRAVTNVNAQVAPKVIAPEAEPATVRAKAARAAACWLARTLAPAGWKRRHGDKNASSNWRSPPRPVEKSTELGRSYNWSPRKSTEGERVEEGPVVARTRGNAR